MIKLQKKVIYYIKKDYHHTTIIKNDSFYTVEDALTQFKKERLKHYKNDKDISAFEELELFIPTSYGMKKYYKKIDPELETIETNYKED